MKDLFALNRQSGLSLVELMIALVLGLILSAGVITIFISAKQDYQLQDAVSQIQENARFSLEFLARDIRMAGYSGCSNDMPTANSIENAPANVGDYDSGINGYDGDNGTLPSTFTNALAGTDAVVIHTANVASDLQVQNHNPNAAQIDVTTDHSFKPGAIMMIVDANCSNRGIFVMSGPTNNNDNADNVVHNTGQTFSYGSVTGVTNCTKALKGEFDCDNMAGASNTAYSDGSSVFGITSVGYYIRDPALDATISSPTLYRVDFSSDYIVGAADSMQPLVEGVSDMDVLYCVKNGAEVQYKTADAVEAAGEWSQVVAVRLEVEAESITQVDGAPLTRTFVRTIQLRNRG
ncbi:PilW family protein [Marinobacter mobilis]|uniref:Type IV pilus assembly protein PilW n=1 Tax=Marinobacter mobilis TaxID=488533 RepID=A0A1H3B7B4_9GAMM|nr:PilW family protein [Marinobacter mobilis]SDX36939.1 type IV pilus assembly protein PilW [Marinobacter mobilis]